MNLKKGNQIFSVVLIRYANSKEVQGKCVQPTEYLKSGRFFNGTGNFCERRRRERLVGVGACPDVQNGDILVPAEVESRFGILK